MTRTQTAVEAAEDLEFRRRLEKAAGGNYEVERMIGEGGFGRVYAAKDVRLDRRVAIKVIRPDLAGARVFSDRFRKEAMALAKFRHPGIVPIYDIQEHEGLIYFVMPLITGDTLRTRIERHRAIAPQETRKLLVDLCQCLAATHRAGIVHRDIKPDNVILEADAMARALLMDFGIAKTVAEVSETNSGMIMGTPTYMSPEQVNGDTVIDHRSDIYSVGVMGYHMLTGRPPFVGASSPEVAYGHLTRMPEAIRKLNPSVPVAMAVAIERCLAKNPDERFQSAADLAAALSLVTFAEPAGRVEERANYAFPFFAGMTVATLVVGLLGADRLRYVQLRDWMWISGGLAALAILCSPMVRVTTDALSRDMTAAYMRRFRKAPDARGG
ncbi:MAG TPA: serine/threonine-protein kinase [Gemmatimonadaceae bacterium]|nr:serine/threonine-protein kinase [Gemmatimonadaceae bacterium]